MASRSTESELTTLLDQFVIPPGSEQRAYDSAMDLLVNTKLLAQFLREQKVVVTDAELQEAVAKVEADAKAQGTDMATALVRERHQPAAVSRPRLSLPAMAEVSSCRGRPTPS